MKIAICDDDYSSCSFIEKTILKYAASNGISIETDIYQTAKSLYQNFEHPTDLLFLDIQLPDESGIEIGHFLRKNALSQNMQIVFISGNPGYALDLFKIHPMDFLIKPLSEADIFNLLDEYVKSILPQMAYFSYQTKHSTGKISYKDILYFSSDARKVIVHLINNEPITIYKKLSEIETEIPDSIFWRIHKSYIVNSRYIASCQANDLKMLNNELLPISKNYTKEIRLKIINQ
jgi:DNA-binding LytR/AlgR family response regulator